MYTFAIFVYALGVRVAALFGNKKAAQMLGGHRDVLRTLRQAIAPADKVLWFHAASLGEFEQGRPLMESIRAAHPGYKILLTFFSPSGYTVRHNYEGADVVCYLPFDTPRNVRRFLCAAHPAMAFFIKYEFWQNYLNALARSGVPTYSVSSIFDKSQVFFKWYGRRYRRVLGCFSHLFVQNEESRRLLAGIGVTDVTVAGDTRFDRVMQIRAAAKELPLVERFCGDAPVFIAGSSWLPDEKVYMPYFKSHPRWKLVIASHEVNERRLAEVASQIEGGCIRYTRPDESKIESARCLLVDCFGLLSSIYRYAHVAYIGGGFGKGIHNLPEAAVYGVPVIFGPNNRRFKEAQDLKSCRGGFQVESAAQFEQLMQRFEEDAAALSTAGRAAGDYVAGLSGAVEKVMGHIKL